MEKDHLTRPVFFTLAVIILLFFPACRAKDPLLDVLEGNSRYSMGDYAGATVNYMKALDKKKYEHWIYYNLGNTYSALGEIEPAIAQYEKALGVDDPELLYRTNFNLGNLYYELGEYGLSVAYYKESLAARSNDIDAKINLELAIKKYANYLELPLDIPGNTLNRSNILDEEITEILESVRKKEESVWKTITEKSPENHISDW